MKKMFQQKAPGEFDEDYSQKASRKTEARPSWQRDDILTPAGLSMPRDDLWRDADKQAAMFHSWLMGEDGTWLADALGLVVNTSGLPMTISAKKSDPSRANIEIHSVRTAMKRSALGWPEPHMVVVVTQWRAGFFDRKKQADMDKQVRASAHPERDFKYRSGCTLLIDPEKMRIRRVIRTPGTVADDGELERMRRYLLDGLAPPNAFMGVAERFKESTEPFAFLHSHAGA
jgi:hypothetical protein